MNGDETRYIVTLCTNPELHDKVTSMRERYFPKHLNKLSAHLTLFHALPESKLESDVIPLLQSITAKTAAFEITAGPPFQMNKGIGISVPRAKGGQLARDVHEALLKPWSRAGFLSEQDSRHGGVHYTIMNKVDNHAEVSKALAKVKSEWSETTGTAVGLALWQYDGGYWKGERVFPFEKDIDAIDLDFTVFARQSASYKVAESVAAARGAPLENGTDRTPTVNSTLSPELPPLRKSRTLTSLNRFFRSTSASNVNEAKNMATGQEGVMDTRTPSPMAKAVNDQPATNGGYQPDLSQEVAMLSTKLINAINFQTTLDDQLQQTKHELEMSQRQFEKLQAEKKYLDDMIQDRVLVRKSEVDPVIQSLQAELAAERKARDAAEKTKKQTEAELENLTSALFEEANEMVAAARKDTEAAEKRNSQLKSKLSDTEVLLSSQQEQLQDLKLTMEKMSERGDNDTARDSVPSTPINAPSGLFEGLMTSPTPGAAELPPEHPLFFSQLLTPVLRNDVAAYNDFLDLLEAARKAVGHMRSSSSGTSTSATNSSTGLGQAHMSGSSPHLPGAFSFTGSSPHNSGTFTPPTIPLKDTRFYKRSLVEDIEPTLRLDQAPGLSFLSRRSVVSSLLQGSLVVEPFMPGSKFYGNAYSCALCGEGRKAEQYARKHRFRTSEDESAQRYPLCDYCLGRIRAAGDFITFLRMVRDGYWRADTEEEQKSAWEESVRLRERMFWARIGGGVVPSVAQRTSTPSNAAVKSARNSLEATDFEPREIMSSPVESSETTKDPSQSNHRVSLDQKLVEVFQRHRKSMSIGKSLPEFSPSGEMLPRSITLSSIEQEPAQEEQDVDKTEIPVDATSPTQQESQVVEELHSSHAAPAVTALRPEVSDEDPANHKPSTHLPSEQTQLPGSQIMAETVVPAINADSVEAQGPVAEKYLPGAPHPARIETAEPEEKPSGNDATSTEPDAAAVEPAEEVSPELAGESVEESVKEPVAEPVGHSAEESIESPSEKPVDQSDEQSSANIAESEQKDERVVKTKPARKAVRKTSSNTSLGKKATTTARPPLNNKKSSENKTGKASQERKQAGGVLARVKAMEAQSQSKS